MATCKIEQRRVQALRWGTLRMHIRDGIKWWAEHQSWPATDEIRVDRHRDGCS